MSGKSAAVERGDRRFIRREQGAQQGPTPPTPPLLLWVSAAPARRVSFLLKQEVGKEVLAYWERPEARASNVELITTTLSMTQFFEPLLSIVLIIY